MEKIKEPSYIVLIATLLTIIVAVESIYYVPWSPYFLIYAILAILIPLRYGSYKFNKEKIFKKRNVVYFFVLLLIITLILFSLDQIYLILLANNGLTGKALYDLQAALDELAVKAGLKFGIPTELAIGIYGIYVILWAPIGEELFYRGYMFGELRKRYGFTTSSIVASSFFGIRHMTHFLFLIPIYPIYASLYWATNAFIFGVLISYAYEKTDTLCIPMLIHFLYNLIDLLL